MIGVFCAVFVYMYFCRITYLLTCFYRLLSSVDKILCLLHAVLISFILYLSVFAIAYSLVQLRNVFRAVCPSNLIFVFLSKRNTLCFLLNLVLLVDHLLLILVTAVSVLYVHCAVCWCDFSYKVLVCSCCFWCWRLMYVIYSKDMQCIQVSK